jgi:hypothetical protein
MVFFVFQVVTRVSDQLFLDLHSLLTEVGGDVELAATRITEG